MKEIGNRCSVNSLHNFPCRNYGVADVAEGKAAAKAELRARMGLEDTDTPLVGH